MTNGPRKTPWAPPARLLENNRGFLYISTPGDGPLRVTCKPADVFLPILALDDKRGVDWTEDSAQLRNLARSLIFDVMRRTDGGNVYAAKFAIRYAGIFSQYLQANLPSVPQLRFGSESVARFVSAIIDHGYSPFGNRTVLLVGPEIRERDVGTIGKHLAQGQTGNVRQLISRPAPTTEAGVYASGSYQGAWMITHDKAGPAIERFAADKHEFEWGIEEGSPGTDALAAAICAGVFPDPEWGEAYQPTLSAHLAQLDHGRAPHVFTTETFEQTAYAMAQRAANIALFGKEDLRASSKPLAVEDAIGSSI